MTYDNTNTGAAFEKEGFKGRSGSLDVEGVEYWVSLYENVSKDGKPYTKIQLKPKTAKPTEPSGGEYASAQRGDIQSPSFADDLDDTVPW